MRIDRALSSLWRRLTLWLLMGEGAGRGVRETGSPESAKNEGFLADLDEAQRRAVLAAICAGRRPADCTTPKD